MGKWVLNTTAEHSYISRNFVQGIIERQYNKNKLVKDRFDHPTPTTDI